MEEESIYYLEVELVAVSYLPSNLAIGMKFMSNISVGVIEPELNVFTLEEIPEDEELFMSLYGAPVKFALAEEETTALYAFNEGWLYDEEEDSYILITDSILNDIINREDGYIWLICDDEGLPIKKEDKLIITKIEYEEEE